jgi:hypothetical protein
MFTLSTQTLKAQSFYGTVAGTVTDASGAIVPGATVTATNTGTNDRHTVKSDLGGNYRVTSLVPSTYRIEVEAANFKHYVQPSITVQVDTTIRVDAVLTIGATSETVEVSTAVPLLQTESGSVGSEVEGKVVQEMPLNGRNVMNLLALVPGVIPQQNTQGSASINAGIHLYVNGFGNYAIGGGIANESAQYVDGAPTNILGGNPPALIMTQDMVQEFKVESNAVSAEYGHFGGGVVNMTSKSGTNAFHGGVYEYVRNTLLNTNDFISKNAGLKKSPYHQNQYGAILGGPIKRDKAFFEFSWENQSIHYAGGKQQYVPTLAERGEDPNFPGGAAIQGKLTDPAIPIACPGAITQNYNVAAGYQSFIPASCFDGVSKIMKGFYAYPNHALSGGINFVGQPLSGADSYQYNGRIDFNLSSKQRIFGRYTRWNIQTIAEDDFAGHPGHDATVPSVYGANHNQANNIVLGDTYTFNPSTIGDFRASYMRDSFVNHGSAFGTFDVTRLGGEWPALAPQMSYKEAPIFGPLIGAPEGGPWSIPVGSNQGDFTDTLSLNLSLIKIVGSHTFKIGTESQLRDHGGIGNYPWDAGQAIFNAFAVGDAWGAFMLGDLQSDTIHTVTKSFSINWSHGAYVTDTWRYGPKLTLNLGVRWDFPGGIYEKKDRATVFLPGAIDPTDGSGGGGTHPDLPVPLPGTLALTNSPLYPSRDMSPSKWNLIAPRFSFAYSVKSEMVIRGGYGLSYIPPDMPIGLMAFNSPVSGVDTNCPGAGPGSWSHPFLCPGVNGTIIQPLGRTDPNPSHVFVNQFIQSPVPTTKYPYMQQWNVSIGKQWKGSMETDITYAGSKGTKLPVSGLGTGTGGSYNSIDQLSPQYYYLGFNALNTPVASATNVPVTGVNGGCGKLGGAKNLNGTPITVAQCLQPFPQYSGVFDTGTNGGSQSYNAIYLSFTKRFRSGGVLNANYSFSRTIGDTDQPGFGGGGSWQNFANPKGERAIASFDVPNRLIINYVLDLPFGKGQRWLNGGGVSNVILGGWQMNGITTEQSGFPYSFTYNKGISQLFNPGNALSNPWGAGLARPDFLPGCNLKTSGSFLSKFKNNNFFNAACVVPAGTNSPNAVQNDNQKMLFGNAPRNTDAVRTQFVDNFDFSVSKNTVIHESMGLLFRAEFFNLFNHPIFGNADSVLGDPSNKYDTTAGNQTALANTPRLVQLSLRFNF